MKILDGKHALVTGGGRGIGREVAIDLAINGVNVAVASRTKSELDNTIKELEKYGVKSQAIVADLSTLEGVSDCASKYFEAFGGIDILINNAGMTHVSSVVDYPIDMAQKLFNLNVMGYYAMVKEVIPKMIEQKSGSIVMTASVNGNIYFPPKKVAYSTSKAAVSAMGRTMAAEFKPYNINVSVVTPAGVETKMANDLRKWGQQMPITVPPEEISPAYVFLSSDLAGRKYKGRVVELNIIMEILPILRKVIGEREKEKNEIETIAEETLKKDLFQSFKKYVDLIVFMLNYKR